MEFVRVYLDDLLCITKGSFEQHLAHLRVVFQRLRDANLKINAPKSFFCATEIEYLGYMITPTGIKPIPKKIEAIIRLQRPKTVKQLKSFLGMVNFYRDTWAKRSHILAPLSDLISELGAKNKHKRLTWKAIHEQAFQEAKRAISREVMLTYPDFTKKFIIHTDASDFQLGAVISQEEKPIAFYSRKLSSSQRNYTTGEKEMLSIVETLKEFRNILLGRDIIIYTDHENLTRPSTQHQSKRLTRWRWLCEEFAPKMIHIKGLSNTAADAISRLPSSDKEEDKEAPQTQQTMFTCAHTLAYYEDVDFITHLGEEHLFYAINNVKSPVARPDSAMPTRAIPTTFLGVGMEELYTTSSVDITPTPQEHLNKDTVDVLYPLGPETIVRSQANDAKLLNILASNSIPELKKDTYGQWRIKNRIWIPQHLQKSILKWYHTMLCHPGEKRLYNTMRQHLFWPGMPNDIKTITRTCPICQKRKSHRPQYGHLPHNDKSNTTPWHTLYVDLIGPYSLTDGAGIDYSLLCLTMVDHATGIFEITQIKDKTAETVALALDRTWFSRYPRPVRCIYDNGSEFTSKEFTELLDSYGIVKTPTTVKNPQANLVERVHQTLGNMLRTCELDQRILDPTDPFTGYLAHCMWAIRSTVHTITNRSPAQLAFGRDMLFDLSFITTNWGEIYAKRKEVTSTMNKRENKKRIMHTYKVGDKALLSDPGKIERKLHRQKRGPYRIESVYPNGIVKIRLSPHETEKVSIRRLTPFQE